MFSGDEPPIIIRHWRHSKSKSSLFIHEYEFQFFSALGFISTYFCTISGLYWYNYVDGICLMFEIRLAILMCSTAHQNRGNLGYGGEDAGLLAWTLMEMRLDLYDGKCLNLLERTRTIGERWSFYFIGVCYRKIFALI